MTCSTKISLGLDKPSCLPEIRVNNTPIMFLRKDGVLFDEAGNEYYFEEIKEVNSKLGESCQITFKQKQTKQGLILNTENMANSIKKEIKKLNWQKT
jgi:hypothetical protein